MPSRARPTAYQILLKTHRLTVFLTASQSCTVASLKAEALSALSSPVLRESSEESFVHDRIPTAPDKDQDMFDADINGVATGNEEIPRVTSTDDFELCRNVKNRGKSSVSTTLTYEVLVPASPILGLLENWEELYVQFRDEDGNLMPVQVSQPSLLDEEEEDPGHFRGPVPSSPEGKGKRKAP